tara:strand:+ start:202 stop:465 length:264 start_codon:yes stop_codon:yes gene_type:complete
VGNDEFDISDITFDYEDYDKDYVKIEVNNDINFDMHGYPIYEDVIKVQDDLKEEQLRNTHPELKKAYEEYQRLLEKYEFWDKFEDKG